MTNFNYKACYATICASAIFLVGCSSMTPSNEPGGASAGATTGISNLTGGAEGQPTTNGGVAPSAPSSGIGNLTGGAEARPAADPGVTPGVPPGK